jgi:hypothetical protein
MRFSDPSVSSSLSSVNEIVATPLELTAAYPLSEPPIKSAALMPLTAYGTESPIAMLVVARVNVAIEPSLTEPVAATND